jgi:hypothetical protein
MTALRATPKSVLTPDRALIVGAQQQATTGGGVHILPIAAPVCGHQRTSVHHQARPGL